MILPPFYVFSYINIKCIVVLVPVYLPYIYLQVYIDGGFFMNSNEKRSNTLLYKYGVTNVAFLPEVQEKRRKTFEDKRTTAIFYQEPRIYNIDAKDLTLYKIDKSIADEWLNRYHPFRAPRGNILCIGLADDSEIYCIMTFKKSRNKKYFAEISRMWMLPTYNIIGGYDILSEFATELGVYNIVAYVNTSFENYLDYESIGMKHIRDIQATKWWICGNDRISDASRRQKKISENELIFRGYAPIYDWGQRVYISE